MKTTFTILCLLFATISFAQPQQSSHYSKKIVVTKVTDFKISVSVNSLEDVESKFAINDLKVILNDLQDNENVSFELVCNGDYMSNGDKSTLSYTVNGQTSELKNFLKAVKKIRKGAINYYKNKQ